MALSLVTGPAVEPITIAEAKAQCQVDTPDDDALISALIQAAREYVESATHRPLITQTWDWKRDTFPYWTDALVLPLPPVSSVTSVTYVATDGTSTTWSSSLYLTDLPTGPKAEPARITPVFGGYYPYTRYQINAVTVRFVCGYGTSPQSVPESLRAAIKVLVAHWYGARQPVTFDARVTVSEIPMVIEPLIWPYKAF